jgi:arylsulfatase A-like enzyme
MRAQPHSLRQRPAVVALLSILAMTAVGCARGAQIPDGEHGTRVVLITTDTLRLDSLTGVDGAPSTMPNCWRRAQEGTWFPRFYAATSSTQPSHSSMMTGLHPWEHGVSRNGQVLADPVETVAEALRAAGWSTAAAVASFPLHHQFGFAQGFERYDDDFQVDFEAATWNDRVVPRNRFYNLAGTMTDKAIDLLAKMELPQQFLWVHYFDPHAPYGKLDGEDLRPTSVFGAAQRGEPVAPVLQKLRKAYDRDVTTMDREIERLLHQLERDSDRFETHVVLAADHGESFGEEGSLGHGKALHAAQIVVPLFIASPLVAPGRRDEVTGSVDIAPTLLALAGLPPRSSSGRSLLKPARGRAAAFGMRRTYEEAAMTETLTSGKTILLEPLRFYAVDRDGAIHRGNARKLDEEEQLAASQAEQLRRLFSYFERRLSSSSVASQLDEESRKALSALGYVP